MYVGIDFPPSESCRSLVSFESLYGMWGLSPFELGLLAVRAAITLPRADRAKLIFAASFKRPPSAPVLL